MHLYTIAEEVAKTEKNLLALTEGHQKVRPTRWGGEGNPHQAALLGLRRSRAESNDQLQILCSRENRHRKWQMATILWRAQYAEAILRDLWIGAILSHTELC